MYSSVWWLTGTLIIEAMKLDRSSDIVCVCVGRGGGNTDSPGQVIRTIDKPLSITKLHIPSLKTHTQAVVAGKTMAP